MIFDWYGILQWESRISNNSCDWGNSWTLKQTILLESKVYAWYRHQQSPETKWTTQIVSRVCWRCGLSEQKNMRDYAAAQVVLATELICSSPIECRKQQEENFQHLVYVSYKVDAFIYLFVVMNSVNDESNANQCNFEVL